MKVILLKDVPKVGRKYEVKEVANGFGRNVIMTRGLGLIASPANLVKLEEEVKKAEAATNLRQELVKKGIKELSGLELNLTGKANKEGHLFASIHKVDIAAAVKERAGVEIDPDWLLLDKPLKTVGEHPITLKVENQTVTFKVTITNIK